jgi:nitric oxide reductase subunit B
VTVSRGHLAFHGAYVLLNLAFFCLAVPRLREIIIGLYGERCGHFGFWCTALGVAGKSLAFAVAGVLQSYLERYEDQPYMVAQPPIRFWMAIAAIHGLVAIVGLVVTIWHLLTLRPATEGQAGRLRTA